MHLSVTEIIHDLVRPLLKPGATALDGTAGNGHDTLFLARCVGPTGRVLAWDLQPVALARTAVLLAEHAVTWVELILGDHAEIDSRRAGTPAFAAAIFNLGYLPAGDKSIRTSTLGSVRAIRAAVAHLAPGGILAVLAYTGHVGGAEEAAAVGEFLAVLPTDGYRFRELLFPAGRSPPPRLFVVERQGL